MDRTKVEQQKTKLQILQHMREQEAEDKLTQRERSRARATNLRMVKRELQQARKQMAKEFIEKKALIIHKLRELKSNNKSIEEIYKYTNEIIVEEEDEEEEEPAKTIKEASLSPRKALDIKLTPRSESASPVNKT